MDALVIVGSIIGSVVAAVIVSRWFRGDKQEIDLRVIETKIQEREKAHDERHRLEMKQIELRLDGHDKLLEKLSKRTHDLRTMFLKALRRAGVSIGIIADVQDEQNEENDRG